MPEQDERIGLHSLKPAPGSRKERKRVGRGEGSGTGKTSGRGHKGAGARSGSKRRVNFEGGQTPLYRRLPKLRGRGKGAMNIGITRKVYGIVNLSQLDKLEANTVVTADLLRSRGIVKGRHDGLRVLGHGDITKALTIQAQHVSDSAREKIEAAGGTVTLLAEIAAAEAQADASAETSSEA